MKRFVFLVVLVTACVAHTFNHTCAIHIIKAGGLSLATSLAWKINSTMVYPLRSPDPVPAFDAWNHWRDGRRILSMTKSRIAPRYDIEFAGPQVYNLTAYLGKPSKRDRHDYCPLFRAMRYYDVSVGHYSFPHIRRVLRGQGCDRPDGWPTPMPRVKYITSVREPMARFLSFYNFMTQEAERNQGPLSNPNATLWTFATYVQQHVLDNYMCRAFLGLTKRSIANVSQTLDASMAMAQLQSQFSQVLFTNEIDIHTHATYKKRTLGFSPEEVQLAMQVEHCDVELFQLIQESSRRLFARN